MEDGFETVIVVIDALALLQYLIFLLNHGRLVKRNNDLEEQKKPRPKEDSFNVILTWAPDSLIEICSIVRFELLQLYRVPLTCHVTCLGPVLIHKPIAIQVRKSKV